MAVPLGGRRSIAYNVEVIREFVPVAIPLLIGNALFLLRLFWEVKVAHRKSEAGASCVAERPGRHGKRIAPSGCLLVKLRVMFAVRTAVAMDT